MNNIILLHGALGAETDLDALAGALKNKFNVYSFSFSGHGKNAFNGEFGIEAFSSELEAFVLGRDILQPAVFGYSMGGYIALTLAARKKNFLSKVMTLGTKFNWNTETVEKETAVLDPESLLKKAPAFVTLLENKHGNAWRELVLRTSAMMREIGEKNFLHSEIYKSIGCPVTLGLADRDKMVSVEETIAVFKSLPDASMYMLP